MKKKKNKLGVILLVLAVLITAVAIILAVVNKKEKTHLEDQQAIKDNYNLLSINVTNNITYRTELKKQLKESNNENYSEKHAEYLKLLNDYDNNIKAIELNYKEIDPRCDATYEEPTIEILCRGYKSIYEDTVNIYVALVSEYNNLITTYNEKSDVDYEQHTMLYSEYVDLNQNGEYQGKDILTK